MFSGIISHTGKVKSILKKNNNCILKIFTAMNFKKNEKNKNKMNRINFFISLKTI